MSYDQGGRAWQGKDGSPGTASGENARAAKLTDAQVREIKMAPRKGPLRVSNAALARSFNVSPKYVGDIRAGRKRRDVKVDA